MPNNVLNEVVFSDTNGAETDRIVAAVCGADGEVDFQVLVPHPVNVWQFSSGTDHEMAFKRIGLDWARENWGTKWNAYSHKDTVRTSTSITFIFETAWRPPYGWLVAVFNTLQRDFDHSWLDEGGPCKIGAFRWPKSEKDELHIRPWTERDPTDAEKRRLHKLHWGVEEFTDENE